MGLSRETLDVAVILAALGVVVLAVWAIGQQRALSSLVHRLRAVTGRPDEGLDEVLDRILRRLDGTDERLGAMNALQQELETLLRQGTIRNVGVVRFNPFPDAGGDQSFAIALLDSEGTGVVLSSLHARTDTRIFAKPVQSGRSRYPLSDEEQDAIRRALAPGERAKG